MTTENGAVLFDALKAKALAGFADKAGKLSTTSWTTRLRFLEGYWFALVRIEGPFTTAYGESVTIVLVDGDGVMHACPCNLTGQRAGFGDADFIAWVNTGGEPLVKFSKGVAKSGNEYWDVTVVADATADTRQQMLAASTAVQVPDPADLAMVLDPDELPFENER